MPYFESDHILNIVYNSLCGGTALEHIEYRRQDPIHINMLGTHSIPEPSNEKHKRTTPPLPKPPAKLKKQS